MEFLGVCAQLPAELVWAWEHKLSQVPIEDAWVTTKLQGAPTTLAQWIAMGTAIAVSDGSFKSGLGTAGWIISSQDSSNRMTGRGCVMGDPSDQCVPRSKMGGLYAVLYICYLVEEQFNI